MPSILDLVPPLLLRAGLPGFQGCPAVRFVLLWPRRFPYPTLPRLRMEREALLSKVFETARHNEKTYFGCTQAVLAALQETMGVGSQEVTKAGTTLAGGVAGRGET